MAGSSPAMTGVESRYFGRLVLDGSLFQIKSDLWYPPADICKIGRLNNDREALFYGSISESASIVEIRPVVGKMFTIAICGRFRWLQGKEASDLNRISRKSCASLYVAWCDPRGLRDLRLKMLAL